MNIEGARKFILHKLEVELPPSLTYHNLAHTIEVRDAAMRLAGQEGITGEDLLLLETAALFHDSGYTFSDDNHEMISCELARRHLPRYDYTSQQIDAICKLIMATSLPHEPKSHLEQIIIDADLDYLGTDLYFTRAEALYNELKILGRMEDSAQWYGIQIQFLEKHKFFTKSAITSRAAKKDANFALLKKNG